MNTHKHSSKINKSPHPPPKKSPKILAQAMLSREEKRPLQEGEKTEEERRREAMCALLQVLHAARRGESGESGATCLHLDPESVQSWRGLRVTHTHARARVHAQRQRDKDRDGRRAQQPGRTESEHTPSVSPSVWRSSSALPGSGLWGGCATDRDAHNVTHTHTLTHTHTQIGERGKFTQLSVPVWQLIKDKSKWWSIRTLSCRSQSQTLQR